MMSYTDGKRAPQPTVSERVFHELTTEERDTIGRETAERLWGPEVADELYPRQESRA